MINNKTASFNKGYVHTHRKRAARWRSALLSVSLLLTTSLHSTADTFCEIIEPSAEQALALAEVVLIMDDMGNHRGKGERALSLPGAVTFAIMPFTPHARTLAESAHARGKEVMLHAPMSTVREIPADTGTLTPQMSRQEFRTMLLRAIDEVPHARGVNNHMGSDLTQRRQQMAWLMQELRWKDLYFVDSRTSDRTVAYQVAQEFNVPSLARHVFLDHDIDRDLIAERFEELVNRAKKRGRAVGIGHPHRATIEFLEQALPNLEDQGVRLISVSDALAAPPPARNRQANAGTGMVETFRVECDSGPNLDTAVSHVSLGLGDSVLPEVEDAGSQDSIGATEGNTFNQVVEVTNPPGGDDGDLHRVSDRASHP